MIFENLNTDKLDQELFHNPPTAYRGVPFWSWNCKVTKELIDAQLPIFRDMGFGGVTIHARTGLDIPYLNEEYFDLVSYAIQRCKELALKCWLYDDDRFPSGSAGGIVTKDNLYRGRYLLVTERKIECAVPLAVYGLNFTEDGFLDSFERFDPTKNYDRVRYAYLQLMAEEAWFEDSTYVDTMNPKAIAEFLRITYEEFYRRNGGDFGDTVPAIFTDEPRLGKHELISSALSHEDVTIPYTEAFAEYAKSNFGFDPLDLVPEYIWDRPQGGSYRSSRYLYRDTAADCFVRAYMDQIAEWCDAHGIAMTGHVLSEDTLYSQAFAIGDCMRCYRNMALPGIDILVDGHEYNTVKQAVSVARQYGRESVSSELYGVTHWDCDFKTFKLQGDWQAALGITARVPHLSHMSLGGEAKRDWPGSIFFHQPWYKQFPLIEDHFARLHTALTRGKPLVNIAVIHPIETMWLHMGPNDTTGDQRRKLDEDHRQLTEWLLFGNLDFDFLSESLLPEQPVLCEDGELQVGEIRYRAVIVPNLETIRGTTLDILEEFADNCGTIIFFGNVPKLVDALPSDRAVHLAENCVTIGRNKASLYQALEPLRNVTICTSRGGLSRNLLYQLREDNGCQWLFVAHVHRKDTNISELEHYTVTVNGLFHVEKYETLDGSVKEAVASVDAGYTLIDCSLYAEDSVLYCLTPLAEDTVSIEQRDPKYKTILKLTEIERYSRSEPNVLLLDYAEYSLDGGERQKRDEILRIDNRIRKILGYPIRCERMCQPYHVTEGETHDVTLYYTFVSDISTEVYLAIEESSHVRIWLNGVEADRTVLGWYVDPALSMIALPQLRVGNNELAIKVCFTNKSNLENIYLLGDFDVVLNGACPKICKKREKLCIGDITQQGMPFYTGNLLYELRFTVCEENEYYAHIPHFKAPLLSVNIDGGDAVPMAYAPHRISLGTLGKGEHILWVNLYGNRFNGFGTLHNANPDYIWYGPDSFRTTGNNWTDDYLVRPVGILSAVEIEEKEKL